MNKYTQSAKKEFQNTHPKVGYKWIADETMIDIDGEKKVWFWDIIDADTRYLLASRASLTRTTLDANQLIKDAVKKAGKAPKIIITDQQKSYPVGIFETVGNYTEHLQSSPFTIASDSTNKIERFHETLKERTKVMKAFRDIETLDAFTDGFLNYYNYLKPHDSLNGKTPAEEAQVKYSSKTWVDIVNKPVPKHIEISSHIAPKLKLVHQKVNLDTAYKRRRITAPRPPVTPKQRRLPIGGMYTNRKGNLISRRKRRGWRRIY